MGVVLLAAVLIVLPAADPLAGWGEARISPVLKEGECHSIHSYYLACPESPDGQFVVLYTSTTSKGHVGRVEVVERATGQRRVLAENVTVEDAHRAACQQWVAGGRQVAFHDVRDGHWLVVCVDVATGKETIIARDRQIGFAQPHGELVPVYSPHWNPGEHRDLELVDLKTGQTRTAVTAEAVKRAYPKWISEKFGDKPVSIFFPVLSPDLRRVMFKMATPAGGDFRSGKASSRHGLIGYDLAAERFLCLRNWGHPAWHPASRAVLDLAKPGLALTDLESGRTLARVEIPALGSAHPAVAPDGRLFTCDRRVAGPGDHREILLGDLETAKTLVVHRFEHGRGAASWRRSDPHPVFSADGRRVYFNVGADRWTRVFVAERP